MHPIARNEDQQYDSEDEISIIDILRFFIDGWKAMLSFTVIGALLGISYVAIGTPQYKATAIIVPAFANGTQVETLVDLRRKLKIPTYYSSETYRACGLEDAVTNGSALAETLVPTLKKDEALDQIEFISQIKRP
jgi:LPS O-antigen subunit length determinant protein (WzzB/FepE family)